MLKELPVRLVLGAVTKFRESVARTIDTFGLNKKFLRTMEVLNLVSSSEFLNCTVSKLSVSRELPGLELSRDCLIVPDE